MTALDEQVLDEMTLGEEASLRVASAAGQLAVPGIMCHLYPFRGSRRAVCGFPPLTYLMPIRYHDPGPCPNNHPLCPVCYPEVMLGE